MDSRESLDDLLSFNKELEQEELLMSALLSKIDKQIHALQVEQLHLLNIKSQTSTNSKNQENRVRDKNIRKSLESTTENTELDLRPISKFEVTNEYEEEEDELNDGENSCESVITFESGVEANTEKGVNTENESLNNL